jgi:hypothetical protein
MLVAAVMGLVLAPALLLPACGDDEGEETGGSTTTASHDASTTTPPATDLTPEEQVEATYLEFVDVVTRLLTTDPDPDDLDLVRLAADPALGRLRDSLTTMRAENQIVERGPRTSQRVMSVMLDGSDEAIVKVCSVGNDTTIDRDDGRVLDKGLTTRVLEALLVLADGQWVVRDVGTLVKLDGEVPCPQ